VFELPFFLFAYDDFFLLIDGSPSDVPFFMLIRRAPFSLSTYVSVAVSLSCRPCLVFSMFVYGSTLPFQLL